MGYSAHYTFHALVGLCYLSAFVSLFVQWDGLLSYNGLLPVDTFVDRVRVHFLNQLEQQNGSGGGSKSVTDGSYKGFGLLGKFGSLVAVSPELGLSPDGTSEVLMFVGMASSAAIFLFGCHYRIFFFLCWASYLSLQLVGQTWLSFQWDILLHEVGFLSIFSSPTLLLRIVEGEHSSKLWQPFVPLTWCYRFLAFKLMFASGCVKLQAACPTWSDLTALEYHFATQCIPTPLAWYAHQLPPLVLRLGVAATLLLEIPYTFFLLAPLCQVRRIAGIFQIIFQLFIMLTGNYNFFNILTIALMVQVCADDNAAHVFYVHKSENREEAEAEADAEKLKRKMEKKKQLEEEKRKKRLKKIGGGDRGGEEVLGGGKDDERKEGEEGVEGADEANVRTSSSSTIFGVQFDKEGIFLSYLHLLKLIDYHPIGRFLCTQFTFYFFVHLAMNIVNFQDKGLFWSLWNNLWANTSTSPKLRWWSGEEFSWGAGWDSHILKLVPGAVLIGLFLTISNLACFWSKHVHHSTTLRLSYMPSSTAFPSSASSSASASTSTSTTRSRLRFLYCYFLVLPREVFLGVFAIAWILLSATAMQPLAAGVGNLLPSFAISMSHAAAPYSIVSSYGLFRRMTGVSEFQGRKMGIGGVENEDFVPSLVARPEVIIEVLVDNDEIEEVDVDYHGDGKDNDNDKGADEKQKKKSKKKSSEKKKKDKWIEIPFHYKPSNLLKSPPWIAPHQPRLDWQMWFAALGSYQQNPWLLHLMHRIMQQPLAPQSHPLAAGAKAGAVFKPRPEISELLDWPKMKSPPKAVRAVLYDMDFTRLNTSWACATPDVKILKSLKPEKWFGLFWVYQYRRANTTTIASNTNSSLLLNKFTDLEWLFPPSHPPVPWWTRRNRRIYTPELEVGNPSLTEFLRQNGIDPDRAHATPLERFEQCRAVNKDSSWNYVACYSLLLHQPLLDLLLHPDTLTIAFFAFGYLLFLLRRPLSQIKDLNPELPELH